MHLFLLFFPLITIWQVLCCERNWSTEVGWERNSSLCSRFICVKFNGRSAGIRLLFCWKPTVRTLIIGIFLYSGMKNKLDLRFCSWSQGKDLSRFPHNVLEFHLHSLSFMKRAIWMPSKERLGRFLSMKRLYSNFIWKYYTISIDKYAML